MISQTWIIGKAIRALFAERVTFMFYFYTREVCLNSWRVSGNDFPLVSGNNRDIKPDISGTSPITIRGSPKLQLFCRESHIQLTQ